MPAIVRTQNKGCHPCRKQIDDGEEAYVTRRLERVQLIAVDCNDLVRQPGQEHNQPGYGGRLSQTMALQPNIVTEAIKMPVITI